MITTEIRLALGRRILLGSSATASSSAISGPLDRLSRTEAVRPLCCMAVVNFNLSGSPRGDFAWPAFAVADRQQFTSPEVAALYTAAFVFDGDTYHPQIGPDDPRARRRNTTS